MSFLFDAFAQALAFFYELVPSYGFAITGLTLLVMVALTPLTLKGTRSMMMMQQLQPEIRKIQSKYKDDRQKLNEELLKFYRENNLNPMGGCLPLLVQMPIFIVLYQVLRGLTRRDSVTGAFSGWFNGQLPGGQTPVTAPNFSENVPFDPAYLHEDSALWQSLHQSTSMNWFGIDLASSASKVMGEDGIVSALPYFVLILIVLVTGVVQQRQIQGRTANQAQTPTAAQQQQIMKIMPFFLPVFSFGLPGGLVLYFAVSNTYRVGQQWIISRHIYGMRKDGSAQKGSGTRSDKSGKAAANDKTKAAGSSKKADTAKPTSLVGSARAKADAIAADRAKKSSRPPAPVKGGAGQSKKSPSASTRAGATPAPTLQPRARKTKKR